MFKLLGKRFLFFHQICFPLLLVHLICCTVTVNCCAFEGLYDVDLMHVYSLFIIYTVKNRLYFRIKFVGYMHLSSNVNKKKCAVKLSSVKKIISHI